MRIFKDRIQAAEVLIERLLVYRNCQGIVLGLARGGVPIGVEIARALGIPFDVLIARKVGAPGQPELALGAIAEGEFTYLDEAMCTVCGVSVNEFAELAAREHEELLRRVDLFRHGRALPPMEGKVVILVDDGVATGSTVRAAIKAIRAKEPKELVFATPVAARETADLLRKQVDTWVCIKEPVDLRAVGYWYENFDQVSDETVLALMHPSDRR